MLNFPAVSVKATGKILISKALLKKWSLKWFRFLAKFANKLSFALSCVKVIPEDSFIERERKIRGRIVYGKMEG